jgi:UDP-N-acetyl-D-mannosaminuronic acid dehydrogenase
LNINDTVICVIGLGYIGLPSASLLATKGYTVHGMDVNAAVVEALNKGDVLIHEPSLDLMVKSAVSSGKLKANIEPAGADIFILSVPTPFAEQHQPDLSYVRAAAKSIAPYVRSGNLVILESTSPVGTTEKVCEWIAEERPDLNIPCTTMRDNYQEQLYVAHCPERVLPGRILIELVTNDRVVGGADAASTEKAVEFYATFVHGKVCATSARTAELVKLTENSFRDVNIAFANELSMICDELGVSVWEVIELANRHPRVSILQPGPGVGGHCIAVDPWFIVNSAPKTARLIRTAREVNDFKPEVVLAKVRKKAARFTAPVVACLGLSFKANVDDMRESPALHIVEKLADEKIASVLVVEPFVRELPNDLRDKAEKCTLAEALDRADIILLLVDHDQFKKVDKSRLLSKVVIDTRGIYVM